MIHKATLQNGANVKASLHANMIIMQIQDDPKSWERPTFHQTDRMQDGKMMFFQHKLQYTLLSQMQKLGLPVFQNEVDILINIHSRQSLLSVRLEYVLKTIMDACNQHIVYDDRLVRNMIVRAKTTINQRVTSDRLEIIIKDTSETQLLSWEGEVCLTEKRIPIAYEIGGRSEYDQSQLDYQADLQRAMATALQPIQSACKGRKVDCHLRFDTLDLMKDADNMALMYLPIIRKLLLPLQDQLLSIGLYKRDSQETDINGTTINLLLA